jgi:hypothetical protein
MEFKKIVLKCPWQRWSLTIGLVLLR